MYSKLPVLLLIFIIFTSACGYTIEITTYAQGESSALHDQPSEFLVPDETSPEEYLPLISVLPEDNSYQEGYTTNSYVIVDTGQEVCYDNDKIISCPDETESFYGQDAAYAGAQSSYIDNGDGTVSDLNTGLMWQQTPDLSNKVTFDQAIAGAETFDLADFNDWRLPNIKELYSLIDFNGSSFKEIPYIDTDYFDFRFGDESAGERLIDAQYWSNTEYVGATGVSSSTTFGVNFADGRIKGYDRTRPYGGEMIQFVRYVRGNPDYGVNQFVDNGDGTVSDSATGLMWQANDSASTVNWVGALSYCQDLESAGYNDWRLPNAKELQSIVDYTRAPDALDPAQQGAAIDPVFNLTETESWYWTSTTHLDSPSVENAVYIAFGQAYGVGDDGELFNIHGAGAQRSDPKSGDPADYPNGRGSPGQNDQIRIYNYARCVRGGVETVDLTGEQYANLSEESDIAGEEAVDQALPTSGGRQSQKGTGGPPPGEAIQACSQLDPGASCQFNALRGSITGTCRSIQNQLACVPDRLHP